MNKQGNLQSIFKHWRLLIKIHISGWQSSVEGKIWVFWAINILLKSLQLSPHPHATGVYVHSLANFPPPWLIPVSQTEVSLLKMKSRLLNLVLEDVTTGQVGWVISPTYVLLLIPRTHASPYTEKWALQLWLRILRKGDYPLSQVGPM